MNPYDIWADAYTQGWDEGFSGLIDPNDRTNPFDVDGQPWIRVSDAVRILEACSSFWTLQSFCGEPTPWAASVLGTREARESALAAEAFAAFCIGVANGR